MDRLITLLAICFIFVVNPIFSQEVTINPPKNALNGKRKINKSHSSIQSKIPAGSIKPNEIDTDQSWDITYTYKGITHGTDAPKSTRDSIKAAKNLLKLQPQTSSPQSSTESSLNVVPADPVVDLDFKGNANNGWRPPDNHIAVSDEGHVVSVINSSLLFADEQGNVSFETSFNDFFSVLNLSGAYFDPRVIYDPSEDKFIMVVLSGNTPSNSTIVVAFSTTSDPNDFWWFYTLDGNPLNNNTWFDFPSIGISTEELYISGNNFSPDGVFDQVIIYQINKANGFTGGNINWLYWNDIRDANSFRDFTITPMSFGFDGSLGPGIFFVSSDFNGGNNVMLYWTTETIDNNPEFVVNSINVPNYSLGGDGPQLGTSDLMSTNDNRLLSGFYADETVHFVLTSELSNGYNGLYYGRIDVPSLTATRSTFGLENFDYAFPSIAPFTTDQTDKSVLIGFLRTSASIYPEFRVVTCNDAFEWSNSVQVRAGDDFVNAGNETVERWGDYSGTARRHLPSGVEVWVSGCYGENLDAGFSNVLSTWIGKIIPGNVLQAPVTNFTADRTSIFEGEQIQFTDLSTNNPSNWVWTLPGGTPNTSTSQNPTVTYNTPGIYSVTLTTANVVGNDTETKTNYITVMAGVQEPVADFTADRTIINEGEQIQFTDLSSNNPSTWSWNFVGGTPTNSSVQNPIVTYNTAGTYTVTLTVTNAAGQDSETKVAYIMVVSGVQTPLADFSANQTNIIEGGQVQFMDLSLNNPTGWSWSFAGGTPSTSIAQNPTVMYNTPGIYDVSLAVSNSAGQDTEIKIGYIIVQADVQAPAADFSANQTNIMEGSQVQFMDLSTNSPTGWSWSFGGGTPSVSNAQNPTVTYNTPGVYGVALTVNNSAGQDTELKFGYITVTEDLQAPVTDFSADQTIIFEGGQVQFTDLSTNSPTGWSWSFAGATPSTSIAQNPTVTYNTPGIYDVSLTAINSVGNNTQTKMGFITVQANVVAPNTDFNANQTVITEGQSITFTDQTANDPTTWSWSFAGGTPSTSNEQNPTILYETPGLYDVALSSSNSAGTDTEIKFGFVTVEALVIAPVTDFSTNQTVITEGQSITFTDQTANDPTTWSWSFAGGTPSTSNEQNPTILYDTPGLYDVALTTTNSAGTDTETKFGLITVEAEVIAPVTDFTANQMVITEGQSITFTDQSINEPTNWAWSFAGGTPSTSNEQNPIILYDSPGLYDVALTTTNSAGSNTQTKTAYITVEEEVFAPVTDFTANQTVITEGQSITFTDQTANDPSTWSWSFAGGTPSTSNEQNPTILYSTPGTFDVALTTSNAAGSNAQSKTGYITVEEEILIPAADFSADQTDIPTGGVVQFTDQSSNTPTSWTWSFPGGTPNVSTQRNPIIVYSEAGAYDVSLVVANAAGNNSITKTEFIKVGVTSVNEAFNNLTNFRVYPNPIVKGNRVNIEFDLEQAEILDFYLTDVSGKVIKYLLRHRAKTGGNVVSFNGGVLASGTYFIVVQSVAKKTIQSEKIILVD